MRLNEVQTWVDNRKTSCSSFSDTFTKFWICGIRISIFIIGTQRSNDATVTATGTSKKQQQQLRTCTTTTWKCLISRFMEDLNKLRRNFIFLSELEYGPLVFNLRRTGLPSDKMGRKNRSSRRTQIHCLSDALAAVAPLNLKVSSI